MLLFILQILTAVLLAYPVFAFKEHEINSPTKIHHSFIFAYNPKGPLITSFKTTFVIPDNPKSNSDQAIALWPGLLNENSSQVLQPVAQWGGWSNGYADSWHLSTWAVLHQQGSKTAKFISSPRIPVEPGTEVTAVIKLASQTAGVYTYVGYFEGYPDTEIRHEMKEPFNSVFLEYEMQRPQLCTDYVPEVVFRNVQVHAGSKKLDLKWAPHIEDPLKCGITARSHRVNAGGAVRIGLP